MTANAFIRTLRAYAHLAHAKRTSYSEPVQAIILSYAQRAAPAGTSDAQYESAVTWAAETAMREYAPNDAEFSFDINGAVAGRNIPF